MKKLLICLLMLTTGLLTQAQQAEFEVSDSGSAYPCLIVQSTGGKRFWISIDEDGRLKATEGGVTVQRNAIKEICLGAEDIFPNTATGTYLDDTSIDFITFAGTGGLDDAGVAYIIPEDYGSGGSFYMWATMDGTGATSDTARIALNITYGASGGTDICTQVDETLEIMTQTYSGTAWRLIKSPSVATGLTLTAGDYIHVELERDPSDASDNSSDSFYVQQFVFKYTSQ